MPTESRILLNKEEEILFKELDDSIKEFLGNNEKKVREGVQITASLCDIIPGITLNKLEKIRDKEGGARLVLNELEKAWENSGWSFRIARVNPRPVSKQVPFEQYRLTLELR